ncbi:hypothetical protein ACFS07_33725 [Undibacterium arcticum]
MKTRKALDDLNRALRELHQALVKVARHEYEKKNGGGQVDPGQLLQLLTRHPQFDWLHQLSEFMVDIDEILDNEMVSKADMRTIFAQAKSMLSQSVTEPSDFFPRTTSRRCTAILRSSWHMRTFAGFSHPASLIFSPRLRHTPGVLE